MLDIMSPPHIWKENRGPCLASDKLAIIAPAYKAMNNKTLAYKRIVLKFGTSLLTGGTDHLDIGVMSALVEQVAAIHEQGAEVVIVTSGAVAAGRQRLRANHELKGVPLRQVLAAVGQGRLMRLYEELFEKHCITVAQALLTRADLAGRAGYLNARNTFMGLLELGIVGIVNENDVVAVDELDETRFGDNDNLSAMVANLVDADLLVILTDIAGLYTADPHMHPEARLIPEVRNIDSTIESMAGDTAGKLGTGGMSTKIEAARLATSSGVNVIIAGGREFEVICRLAQDEAIGTRFIPATSKLESRERWMLSGLCTRGCLVVDDGAARALMEQNKSLLPAGVKTVQGEWERGDIVDVCNLSGARIASGITNYSSRDAAAIKGQHSVQIAQQLGHDYGAEVIHRNNMVLLHRRANGTG
jgi:glutamate 5-kinase